MELRDGMATMSLTGAAGRDAAARASTRRAWSTSHLLPNLLVSAHPDYVMTHRMVPLAPGRTWVECSWLVAPGADGSVPDAAGAVEFWDITNRQDWAACESVQRGLASPHFRPGPFAPQRGRRRRPGDPDRPGLPRGRVRVVTRQRGTCSVQVRWETCCSPSYAVAAIATS